MIHSIDGCMYPKADRYCLVSVVLCTHPVTPLSLSTTEISRKADMGISPARPSVQQEKIWNPLIDMKWIQHLSISPLFLLICVCVIHRRQRERDGRHVFSRVRHESHNPSYYTQPDCYKAPMLLLPIHWRLRRERLASVADHAGRSGRIHCRLCTWKNFQ
jgi:hypothetical protein